jgi:hypothetical protein
MARWARTEVALAAAATILAALLGGATVVGRGDIASDTVIASTVVHPGPSRSRVDSVVAHALATGASSEQVMNALIGPASGEWLLSETVAR